MNRIGRIGRLMHRDNAPPIGDRSDQNDSGQASSWHGTEQTSCRFSLLSGLNHVRSVMKAFTRRCLAMFVSLPAS